MAATTAFAYTGEDTDNVTAKEVISAAETETAIDTGTVVNVGTGSGTDNEMIGHLLPGTQVEVTDEENGWYKGTVSEQTGYVCGDYLDVTETMTETRTCIS